MNIDRAKMRVRISVGHKNAKNMHNTLKALVDTVEVDDWEEGNLQMVSSIVLMITFILRLD
jgi:hypothetical protein